LLPESLDDAPAQQHPFAREHRGMDDIASRWDVVDGRLHAELTFADFAEAFAFMTQVAALAEAAGHHPDWSNSWNRVVIDLVSHDVGAITDRDRSLAAQIDALLDGD
jgi:4a-hydroxytetrahydrobiopterin dehydratase